MVESGFFRLPGYILDTIEEHFKRVVVGCNDDGLRIKSSDI